MFLSLSDSVSVSVFLSLSVSLSLSLFISFSHTQRDFVKKGIYWVYLFYFITGRVDARPAPRRPGVDAAAGSGDQQEGNLATGARAIAVGIRAGQGQRAGLAST